MRTKVRVQQLAIDFSRPADHGVPAPAVTRFWRYVDQRGECWLWTGSVQSSGYGQFRDDRGEKMLVHRFSLELHRGAPPSEEMLAIHSCDVRRCVNPAHLRWGTTLENQRDKAEKGRARNQYTRRREA